MQNYTDKTTFINYAEYSYDVYRTKHKINLMLSALNKEEGRIEVMMKIDLKMALKIQVAEFDPGFLTENHTTSRYSHSTF